jgi:RHS repeat-associated protein
MKFMPSLRLIQLAKTFGLLIFTLLLSSNPANAQYGGTPLAQSPGSPVGSYPLSDIDTVNLFNGRVSVRMPVLTAQGRGGAAGQITFNWSSPANYHIRTDIDPNNFSQINYVEPGGGGAFSVDGLSTGFAQVYGVQSGSQITFHCWMGDYYTYQKTLTRMYFVEPDGTEHEMRDVQTGGQAFSVPVCSLNGTSRGKVFVSTDGSGATFIADQPVVDYVYAGGDFPIIAPAGYLLLSNGTRYRVNDGAIMRDHNGNLLTGTYDINLPVFQYKIKDSLNRQIVQDFNTACAPQVGGNCQKLSYSGFNGSPRAVYLTYGNPIRLILPNNLEYKFHNNEYGDLMRIELPTGGSIEYDYGPGIDGPQPDPYAWIQGLQGAIPGTYPLGLGPGVIYRRVTERRVYKEGHVLESRQTFSKPEYYDGSNYTPANLGYVDKKQYDANGNLLSTERHFFFGAASNSFSVGPIDYPSWKEGREYHSEFYNQSGALVRQTNMTWEQRAAVPWWGGGADSAPQNDPRLSQSVTVLENGQSTTTTNGYDPTVPYNSLTDVYTYDYGGGLLRHIQTSYVKTLNGTAYNGVNITNPNSPYMRELASQVSVFDGGGGERSRTSFEYDNYAVDANHAALVSRSGISGLDASFSSSYAFRGNVTKVTGFLLTNGVVTGSVASYSQYDVAGNVVKAIDGRGYASTIAYTDVFGAPNGDARINSAPLELSSVGQMSYAFPTSATNALTQTAYVQFDYYLGQPVDIEDPNGVTKSAAFNDPLDRPTQLIQAANQSTTVKSQTSFSYNDTTRTVTSTSDLSSFNDPNPLKAETVYDSLGRVIENREYEGGTNYTATQTQYDALGRPYKNSRPFRPWQGESPVWTTSAFDALGRVISITSPDNAVGSTSYSGNTFMITDPAGKARKSVTDALGRLTAVYEDPNGVNYQTSYAYDCLDNLTIVTQGVQTRTFGYDSLRHLTSATNPESGTTTYQYDANGNMTQRTDARGVVSTYVFDALNRNTSIDYSDATPDVFRQYDLALKGIGRINQVWQSGTKTSATNIDSYDAIGRPLIQRQRYETSGVWSASYQITQAYNQGGRVTSRTYPSGHTVSYSYDSAGRTSGFTGNLGDGTNRNYATGITYSSSGELARETFGTNIPLYRKMFYNIRGQLFDTRLSSVNDLWDWNRGRLILYYSSNHIWGQSGTDNNGNVRFAETWIPPENATLDQADTLIEDVYSYDSLNRLTSVQEQQTSVAGGWGNWQQQFRQQYALDRYGNRTIDAAQTWGTGINNKQFTVSTANNRLGVPVGQTGAMAYDNVGNLTNDTYTGVGARTYDAENRMITAADNTGQVSLYSYNADGQRVRRQVASSQEEWQIYGLDGELLAEYAAGASTSAPEKEYGYRGGELLVTASGRFNVAAAAAGAVATASTAHTCCGFSTTGAINGNNRGPWGNGEGWNDATPDSVPDWIQVDFAGSKTIDEINVFSLHDNYTQQNTPTETQTFTLYGLLSFDVQYWNGSSWVTVPGGSVTGNNKVWRKFTFAPLTTSKIRVWINAVPDSWSRVVEIQAFGTSAGGEKIQWLVTDHLGTPRMVVDQTGSLANIKRHDYLPFGEELFTGRSAAKGYLMDDGVRQQFTQYERDNETDLDYAQARYYANVQGRFTSADSYSIFFEMERGRGARERAKILNSYASEPQNWNRYSYCINDPVNLIDPTGLIWLTKDNENYQWVDDDRYRKEDWEGYTEVEAGTIAYFGEGWGGYADKYKGLMGSYVSLNADGSLSSAGAAPDDQPSSSGYIDINISFGTPYFIGPTGGVMFDRNGWYPYIGGGFMNPGLSGSVTGSNDSVSGGFNAELQGGYGPLYGSVGTDQEGNTFLTHGAGYGVSATAYYVFGAPHPRPGPHKPMNNDSRNSNSNSNRRPTETPGRSNCACNRN